MLACLNARGDEESMFCLVWRSCEARAGLLMCGKERDSHFNRYEGHVKLVQACLIARGDEESIFSLLWR